MRHQEAGRYSESGLQAFGVLFIFHKRKRFQNLIVCPAGIIGSDDPITIADLLSGRSIGNTGLEEDVRCTLYECLLFLVTGRSVMLEPEALKRQFQ